MSKGYMSYKLKNLFKSKETIELEAKMEYRRNERTFKNYSKELKRQIIKFQNMAVESERQGKHANAMTCMKFVDKLQRSDGKVDAILQRFEMMNAMMQMSDVMVKFMESCAKMGYRMKSDINLSRMMSDSTEMNKALMMMDSMSDQMESVFSSIDGFADDGESVEDMLDGDKLLEDRLSQLMDRGAAAPQGVSAGEQQKLDDEDAEIRRKLDSLSM